MSDDRPYHIYNVHRAERQRRSIPSTDAMRQQVEDGALDDEPEVDQPGWYKRLTASQAARDSTRASRNPGTYAGRCAAQIERGRQSLAAKETT